MYEALLTKVESMFTAMAHHFSTGRPSPLAMSAMICSFSVFAVSPKAHAALVTIPVALRAGRVSGKVQGEFNKAECTLSEHRASRE